MQLLELRIALQAVQGQQARLGHKIDCQVQLPQGLTALQVLDLGQVVDGQVQVLELLRCSAAQALAPC